jgi:hypothetical protein
VLCDWGHVQPPSFIANMDIEIQLFVDEAAGFLRSAGGKQEMGGRRL